MKESGKEGISDRSNDLFILEKNTSSISVIYTYFHTSTELYYMVDNW